MTRAREYWFQIEQVLEELSELLEATRAKRAQLGWSQQETALLGPGAYLEYGPRAVPDHATDPLFGRPLRASDVERASGPPGWAADRPQLAAVSDSADHGGQLGALRTRMRERLSWLRGRLREGLASRDAYLVLFALVLHIDELAGEAVGPGALEWRPLQVEFFDVDDGGEIFFSTLEQVLREEETPTLVYEVFMYCLKDGFTGRYAANRPKIEEYIERLSARIPTEPMASRAPIEGTDSDVELVEFPRRYYAYALGLGAAAFVVLRLWGAVEGSAV